MSKLTFFDLHAMDALHVAAALSVAAEEFITSERSEKPINKLTAITVRTIKPTFALRLPMVRSAP